MTAPAALPERLRWRVVALVSAVLPSVTPVPAPLRKVAGFAPARRARLGGGLIWDALADEDFRAHAAVQVAALPVGDGDPIDAAARAWLIRDEGWEAVVAEAVESLDDTAARDDQAQAEVGRLTAQVASLQAELASTRTRHKDELDSARADYKVLRQRLGEARGVLRAAEEQRDAALVARDEAIAAADAATKAAEADVRRLRAQLEEAESALAATRRDSRSERDAGTIRARLLLDAVVESATGLRRELGLPAVSGAPGDAVEAELAGRRGRALVQRAGHTGPAGADARHAARQVDHRRLQRHQAGVALGQPRGPAQPARGGPRSRGGSLRRRDHRRVRRGRVDHPDGDARPARREGRVQP